jgi:hypothetical protein
MRKFYPSNDLKKGLCEECTESVPDHIPQKQEVRFAKVIYERRMKNATTR